MQPRSLQRSGRQFLRLFGLFASLLTAFAQAGGGVTIAPIPNQILYVGGPTLVVPLQVIRPPGVGITFAAVNARGTQTPRIATTLAGTNWMLNITAPPTSQGLEIALGNYSIGVSARQSETTNVLAQTSFLLTLLPAEFTGSQFLPDSSVMSKGLWADLDGNGSLDFAGLNTGGTSLYFERNSGGLFSANTRLAVPLSATGVVPADFDGDGRIDLLLLGNVTKPLLLNRTPKPPASNLPLNVPFAFTNVPLALTQTSRTGAAWADLDGDGDLDLILVGPGNFEGVALPVQQFRNDAGVLVSIPTTLPS
ncbi:MAG TPA: VCBS repeat-containing protein, partial [Candidatus Limnocylindria bacterium]|nr:VCBS repeat-containing protein [Candidatus Limnocylindria bacterium]